MKRRTKVLCITGPDRSGSTILDTILGQVDGFFSCGELQLLFDNGLRDRHECGCGVEVPECPVWKRIVERAFGALGGAELDRLISLRDEWQSLGSRLRMALPGGRERLLASPLRAYAEAMESLYGAIAATTGCRVVVDSSKTPAHLALLQKLPSIELYVVRLVRDARAVAYSWRRMKRVPGRHDAEFMVRLSLSHSARQWNLRLLSTAALCRGRDRRSSTVRYEDFARAPRETIRRLVALVGEDAPLPFVDERHVELRVTHTVAGNPGRYQSGAVEIRLDDEWKREMKRFDRTVVTAMTWPLLLRHGYLRSGNH